jgi:hypothetical protein
VAFGYQRQDTPTWQILLKAVSQLSFTFNFGNNLDQIVLNIYFATVYKQSSE